jgi:hypothetical protein
MTLTTELFIERSKKIHGNRYDYSKIEYISQRARVSIICREHGEFKQIPSNHLMGRGCRQCGYKTISKKTRSNLNIFLKKAKKVHKNKYDYSKTEYVNSRTHIIIICQEHGEFKQLPADHITGRGCRQCGYKISNYSEESIKWLNYISKKNNIYIEHAKNKGEYVIPDTRLRVDGYDRENNTVYEYYGCFFHGCLMCFDIDGKNARSGKLYKQLLDDTIKREKIIKEKGHNLVSIWEHEWKNLKKTI